MNLRLLMVGLFLSSLTLAKVAPSFRGETLDGKKISLRDQLRPKKYLLLSFWATWCTPCIEELRSVSEKLKSDPNFPIDILTVNVDTAETSADVKPTLKLYKFDFPVISDPKHQIFTKYQNTATLPYSVLIDSKGEIRQTYSGYSSTMFDEIQKMAQKDSNATSKN